MAVPHAKSRLLTAVVAALTLIAVSGCGSDDSSGDPDTTTPPDTPQDEEDPDSAEEDGEDPGGSVEVADTMATDLPSPWGLVVLPDDSLLLASRDDATIARVDPDSGEREVLTELSGVDTAGEAGLLGLAFDDDRLYAYYTAGSDNRVVAMEFTDGELGEPEPVLDGIPKDQTIHHGGGLAFGPDGMLYAATGDANEPDLAQDPDSLAGKILRMTPDGEVPEDNPDPDSLVYSLGHRNVQGLAWDDQDQLWASEFGANDVDELNLIEPGGNYGWPVHEGSGGADDGYTDPAAEWPVSEASPSGLAFASDALWMAGLRGERLWRIPVDADGGAGEPEDFLAGEYGRLRTVVATGDDELLVATNETDTRGTPEPDDDRILRLQVR